MRMCESRKHYTAALILIAGMMMTGCSAPATANGGSTFIGVAKEEQPSSSDTDLQLAFSTSGSLNGLSASGENPADETMAENSDTDSYAGAAGVTIVVMDSVKARNEKKYSAWGITRVMSAIGNLKDYFHEDTGTAGIAEVISPAVTVPQETEAASAVEVKSVSEKKHTSKNNGRKAEESSASPELEQRPGDSYGTEEKEFGQFEENGILTDISDAKITVTGNRITGESDPSVKVTLSGVEVSAAYYTVTTEKNSSGTGVTITISGDGEHFQGSATTSYTLG